MTTHITDEMIISYQLGELSETDHDFLEQHVKQCDSCSLLFDEWNELQHAWEEPDEELYNEDFTKRVMAAIYQVEKGKVVTIGKKHPKLGTFIHFSAAAAATYLFVHYGLFDEIESFSSHFVVAMDQTTNQVNRFTSEGISIFSSFDFSSILRNLK